MLSEAELFRVRIAMLQAFLREREFDGILITRPDNFAMATGGKRNYINLFTDKGANSLFVRADGRVFYVGNVIETPRAMEEELAGLGCEILEHPWYQSSAAETVKAAFSGILCSDDGSLGENVNGALAYPRALLTETELEKYRRIGAMGAEAMNAVLESIRQGDAEADIAARLVAEGAKRRCLVPVALIAADDRIARYRHPLPTVAPLLDGQLKENAVQRYVMVVACFAREGLIASMTRFKRVDDVDETIVGAYDRICAVDAITQEATQPGKTLGDVFGGLRKAYTDMGFSENEWHNHHQGGATGYAGRTAKGSPSSEFPVLNGAYENQTREISGIDTQFGHAFAWNPSARGVKSEDTFILLPDGTSEIITATPNLPAVDLERVLGRPTPIQKSGMAV